MKYGGRHRTFGYEHTAYRFHIKQNFIVSDINMATVRSLEIMLCTVGSVGITYKAHRGMVLLLFVITLIQDINNYLSETNHVCTVCNVAALL